MTYPQFLKILSDHREKNNFSIVGQSKFLGVSHRALLAAVQIIGLYQQCHEDSRCRILLAFKTVVMEMQPKCRYFAFHAIAHVMDWGDRAFLWDECGLPMNGIAGTPECECAPKGNG